MPSSPSVPQQKHAHIHIDAFLALSHQTSDIVTVHTPESIGMRIETLSVRDVARIIGPLTPVRVIDVRYQEELSGWTLGDLVEYFEEREQERRYKEHDRCDEAGVAAAATMSSQDNQQSPSTFATLSSTRERLDRSSKTANAQSKQDSRILNQISLELSLTPLSDRVHPPPFVRDVSWAHQAWPQHLPVLQTKLYCLTSAAGSYTDFHIDFGGTTVWYHVVSGEKEFLMIEPTDDNLSIYEEWLCSKGQESTFLPTLLADGNNYTKVTLRAGETMVIPSGWMHAVYTAEDAVVFGGNFLHGSSVLMQMQAYAIEARSKVPTQMRFPYFEELHFYAGAMYLQQLRRGKTFSRQMSQEISHLNQALNTWWTRRATTRTVSEDLEAGISINRAALEASRICGCSSVEAMLLQLQDERLRVKELTHDVADNSCGLVLPSSPKIRLKLSAPKLKKTTNTIDDDRSKSNDDDFRIKLSLSSTRATNIPHDMIAVTHTSREDTDWINESVLHKADDEWVPSANVVKASGKRSLSKSGQKHKPTNARERLSKKLR
ncbi:hypothetical protein MPSEU_000798800 [Mayamaea pseudoterrestris]|nr:hypothetical protein MPSEU_000798800 [Mayamaea pseudoterrestris]